MRSKIAATFLIVTVTLLFVAGVIFAINQTSNSITVSSEGDVPVYSSVAGLTQNSDVIIVATVKAEIGTRRIPQGDPARGPDPGRFSILREFELSAEAYLKGDKGPSPVVSISIGTEEPRRGEALRDDREAQPLEVGDRYILFLREAHAPTYVGLATIGEPWRFRLENGQANVVSPIPFSADQFPATESELRRIISAAQ